MGAFFLAGAVCFALLYGLTNSGHSDRYLLPLAILFVPLLEIMPVSYTHLDLAVYEVGRAAKALPGVLEAYDMTPEATAVKLMWVLGQTTDRAEAEKLFLTPVQWDIL